MMVESTYGRREARGGGSEGEEEEDVRNREKYTQKKSQKSLPPIGAECSAAPIGANAAQQEAAPHRHSVNARNAHRCSARTADIQTF